MIELILGDCIEEMKKLPDNFIDSIVTDPPAGISFMGKEWDDDKGGRDNWIKWMEEVFIEVKRVLKPGGHCFVWALPRTSHWTATSLENAGFEIRDIVTHVFGSGFPKSHNIQKKIEGEIKWKIELVNVNNVEQILSPSIEVKEMDGQDFVQENVLVKIKEEEQLEYVKIVDWNTICQQHILEKVMGFSVVMNVRQYGNNNLQVRLITIGREEDLKGQMVMLVSTSGTENINLNTTSLWKNILEGNLEDLKKSITLTKLKTIIGLKTYNLLQNQNTLKSIVGQGTALKPASEHWILCRKPLSEKTIADNVLKWGTGGINIDKCRIPYESDYKPEDHIRKITGNETHKWGYREGVEIGSADGRFPANFIHDGSDEVMKEFDKAGNRKVGWKEERGGFKNEYVGGKLEKRVKNIRYEDNEGSAARFFYCSKTSSKEKNEGLDDFEDKLKNDKSGDKTIFNHKFTITKNHHPTVKPIKLMTYLINMITPLDGIVLDPFMGSGSTGVAAVKAGLNFIGIEKEFDYMEIAKARIEHVIK